MRIRKNMKLSSLVLATSGHGGEKQETYLCHFNQSPWDVIPVACSSEGDCSAELSNLLDSSWFLPCPSSSSPPLIHKADGEDNAKVSLGNSNGAAKRLNSSVHRFNLNAAAEAEDYESDRSPEPMDQTDNSDKKSKSLEPDSSPDRTSGDGNQVAVSKPAPPKRGRPRGSGKKPPASTSAANPYEFYYYSGFGPRWGRKRGCENMNIMSKKSNGGEEDDQMAAIIGDGSSSFDGVNYVTEDCEVVDQESSDHGKGKMKMRKPKRGRKPVKERSLKSLM